MGGQLGLGVMINRMGGNADTVEAVKASLGKKITDITLFPQPEDSSSWDEDHDTIQLTFEDGSKLKLWDAGQSCCEQRYMRTDDDLPYHVGAELKDLELREGPSESEGEYESCHDIEFLLLTTSKGVITMANHNEHNGYYGGFSVNASCETAPETQNAES